MSMYGRLWEEHRDYRKRSADAYRALADAIERGAGADEVKQLDKVAVLRRQALGDLQAELEACPE